MFIDEDRLSLLGLTLGDLARFLEAQPFVFSVFTHDDVRRAAEAANHVTRRARNRSSNRAGLTTRCSGRRSAPAEPERYADTAELVTATVERDIQGSRRSSVHFKCNRTCATARFREDRLRTTHRYHGMGCRRASSLRIWSTFRRYEGSASSRSAR